jgi:hypothetical protein
MAIGVGLRAPGSQLQSMRGPSTAISAGKNVTAKSTASRSRGPIESH